MEELQFDGEYTEQDELIEEMQDVADKLNSIIEDLNSGRPLDETQKSFLKIHNIN